MPTLAEICSASMSALSPKPVPPVPTGANNRCCPSGTNLALHATPTYTALHFCVLVPRAEHTEPRGR
jgi:hypothetical protein